MNVISRKDAVKKGLTQYFTGRVCKKGHLAERNVTNKECADCVSLRRLGRVRKPKKADSIFITKAEAISMGFDRFRTGLLCKNGHTSERIVKTGHCVECVKEAYRKLQNKRLLAGVTSRGAPRKYKGYGQ